MIRAIAIISCLIATLFLVPVQGECNEMSEYESETESELCVMIHITLQSDVSEAVPKLSIPSVIKRHHYSAPVKTQHRQFHLPVRILNCVFRE